MNRREAIEAIAALPGLTSISRSDLRPNDVIVIECDALVSADGRAKIQQYVNLVWPDHRCVVLCGGHRLKVVRSA
jgi:hypothetical protein